MLTQNDHERERYESRLKAQRDALSLIEEVNLRAQEIESKRGEIQTRGARIGVIHLCQRRLNRPLTPLEELKALPLDERARLAEQLEQELFK